MGWILGIHTYYLQLSENLVIVIDIEVNQKSEDCCTFFEILQFEIQEYEYEKTQYSDIIKVEV